MTDDSKSYRDGLIDGKLLAIEEILATHKETMKNHDKRLSNLEKASWLVLGAVALIQFWPTIEKAFQ